MYIVSSIYNRNSCWNNQNVWHCSHDALYSVY